MKYILILLLVPFQSFCQKPLDKYEKEIQKYRNGSKDYTMMPYLAYTSKFLKDDKTADEIAQDYIENYLLKSDQKYKLSKGGLEFVATFTSKSTDKGFELLFTQGKNLDEYSGNPGFSQSFVDYIIAKEEIDPMLWQNSDVKKPIDNPKWEEIQANVERKFTASYAERTVLNAQLRWFNFKKDSAQIARLTFKRIERYGFDTIGLKKLALNNEIYNLIFKYITDKTDLKKASTWMEILLKNDTDNAPLLDTYANLLYKIGNREKALQIQERAAKLAPSDKDIQSAWEKMKKGQPTW